MPGAGCSTQADREADFLSPRWCVGIPIRGQLPRHLGMELAPLVHSGTMGYSRTLKMLPFFLPPAGGYDFKERLLWVLIQGLEQALVAKVTKANFLPKRVLLP